MNYRYFIYVDRRDGKGAELAAWYDEMEDARKEVAFMKKKGYEVEIRCRKNK